MVLRAYKLVHFHDHARFETGRYRQAHRDAAAVIRAYVADGRLSELREVLSYVDLSSMSLPPNELEHLALRQAAAGMVLVMEPLSEGASFRIGQRQDTTPETRPDEPSSPRPETSTFFELEVVDEIGEPIDGVPLTFTISGKPHAVTTDGAGKARVDINSEGGEAVANHASVLVDDVEVLREVVRPRWDAARAGDWLLPDPERTLSPLRSETVPGVSLLSERLHTLVIQPWVIRARLIGMFFDTNKCFVLPQGLSGVRGIAKLYEKHPGSKLLSVGHTDTTGTPSFNDPLSLERAQSVAAYLRDDIDHWLSFYGLGVAFEKRWGAKEDNDMLLSLPDHATKPPDESSVRWFQRTRGLSVDGVSGNETRRALIGEYMAHDGTTLPPEVSLVTHGCGETFPDENDASGDEDAKAHNRRVELYFFDGAMGVQPPAPGDISKPGSTEYPEWVRRAQETDDFNLLRQERDCHFSFVLLDDSLEEPIPNEPFSLEVGDGQTLRGETDEGGVLSFGDVAAGDYLLEIQGKAMFIPALSKSEVERPIRVRDDQT